MTVLIHIFIPNSTLDEILSLIYTDYLSITLQCFDHTNGNNFVSINIFVDLLREHENINDETNSFIYNHYHIT